MSASIVCFGFTVVICAMVRKFCRPSSVWEKCRGWASCHLVELGQIFFPASCPACGQNIFFTVEAGKERKNAACSLCENCVAAFTDPRLRCDRCGLSKCSGSSCEHCQRLVDQLGSKNILWQRMFVLGTYNDCLRAGIIAGKRPSGEALVVALSKLLVSQQTSMRELRVDAVIPVPMHWRKRWVRGTNAADIMAKQIASSLRVPYRCDIRCKRLKSPQKLLSAKMRTVNMAGMFYARGNQLKGKRVLVVDDVATTGATLSAITHCLLEIGATVVYAAVLARTDEVINYDSKQ